MRGFVLGLVATVACAQQTTQPNAQVPVWQNSIPPTRSVQNASFSDLSQSYSVTGFVQMEDGNPPPEPVSLERVCNQFALEEGTTALSGKFDLELGRNVPASANASVGSGTEIRAGNRSGGQFGIGSNIVNFATCILRAKAPGFRSDEIRLNTIRSGGRNDVGKIVIHPLAGVKGMPFSGTTGLAPADARKAYAKGQQLLKQNKWEAAQKEFEKATKVYPKFAIAWYELGLTHHDHGQLDAARAAYLSAIEADDRFVRPYAELARLSAMQRNWKEAVEWSDKVIALNPYVSPDSFFYGAVAQFNLKNAEDAEQRAKKAAVLDASHKNPKIQSLLGTILLQKGDRQGAAEQWKEYLQYAPTAKHAEAIRARLAGLEQR